MENHLKIENGTYIGSTIAGRINNYGTIHNGTTSDVDFEKAAAELKKIKQSLNESSDDYHRLSALESTAKSHSKETFFQMLKSFASQFSVATAANLAGGYLGRFL